MIYVPTNLFNIYRFPTRATCPAYHKPLYIYFIYLFTAIGLLPGGSGYFTCKQNMKLVTTRFNSGGLHEKHLSALISSVRL